MAYVFTKLKDSDKKTLVIHPTDNTTDFLHIIYENHLDDWTIINDCDIKQEELKELIRMHDRIIMVGHGTPSGLLNPKNDYKSLIIDDSFADLLREKNTLSIWCNSDCYFRRNNIKGLHTGMIISEVDEEEFVFCEVPLNEKKMLDNMVLFSEVFRDCIDETDPNKIQKYVLDHYTGEDKITDFNRQNIVII